MPDECIYAFCHLYVAITHIVEYVWSMSATRNAFYAALVFCCRFWLGPIVTFIAFEGIPKWTREKVVNGVNLLVILLGHVVFLVSHWMLQFLATSVSFINLWQISCKVHFHFTKILYFVIKFYQILIAATVVWNIKIYNLYEFEVVTIFL